MKSATSRSCCPSLKRKMPERLSPMIEGVGIDVVEIPRMARTIGDWGGAWLERILTVRQLAYSRCKNNPTHHYGTGVAVKEAVAKAIAPGWSSGFRWQDVVVDNTLGGKRSSLESGSLSAIPSGG